MKSLEQIKARLEAATPGPWVNQPRGVVQSQVVSKIIFWDDEPNQGDKTKDIKPNYSFIAHAPTDIARLIKALEKAVEQRDGFISTMSPTSIALDAELERILCGEAP